MPDERAARRADFSDGYGVVLDDNQRWVLPLPWARLYPAPGEPWPPARTSFGRGFDELMERLRDAQQAEDGDGFVLALMEVGRDILIRNYELSDGEISELLGFWPAEAGDGSLGATWDAILDVAAGRGGRSQADWARCSFILATGYSGPILYEDFNEILAMAAALRRIVPAEHWVPELIEARDRATAEGFGW